MQLRVGKLHISDCMYKCIIKVRCKNTVDVFVPFIQVPEVDTAVRSLTVMWDGSMVVAANNRGTCYVWRLLKGTQVSESADLPAIVHSYDFFIFFKLMRPLV